MNVNEHRFKNLQVFLVCLQPDRLRLFELRDAEEHPLGLEFSEPVKYFEHSSTRSLICIIYDSKRLVKYLAIGHRGYGGGTGLTQLEMSAVKPIANPFPLNNLKDHLIRRFENLAAEAFHSGGLLTPKTSYAVLDALLNVYPTAKGIIAEAINNAPNPIRNLNPEQQFGFQQQQDAVLMSLEFAGLDRKAILKPDFNLNQPPKSFLEGLPQIRLREGPMLTNDFKTFPGFNKIEDYVQNATSFSDGKTLLTILLVHEQPLEGLVGADLIYCNETFKSFVMVQYKAMEKEGTEHLFRLPNDGLDREVENMSMFSLQLEEIENLQTEAPNTYRLNYDPFFLKFCPRIIREPDNIDLIPGMYLPLDYWLRLEASPQLDGDKGGRALRYGNAGRYLTNTDFAALVRNAWMGTRVDQSAVLEKVILHTLKTGRAVTIAQAITLPPEAVISE